MPHPNEVKLHRAAQMAAELKTLASGELPDPVKQELNKIANELEGMKPAAEDDSDNERDDKAKLGLTGYKERTGVRTFKPGVTPAVPTPPSYDGLLAQASSKTST